MRISTGGAREPLWGPSGRELFYRGANALMTVSVETNPELRAGTPKVVFQDGDYFRGGGVQYDIGPNGRFLMINQGDVSTITSMSSLTGTRSCSNECRSRRDVD